MIQQASWDSTHQGINVTLLSKDYGGTNMEELIFLFQPCLKNLPTLGIWVCLKIRYIPNEIAI